MTKPPLGKVEALLYVLQHVTKKRMCQNFDTPSLCVRLDLLKSHRHIVGVGNHLDSYDRKRKKPREFLGRSKRAVCSLCSSRTLTSEPIFKFPFSLFAFHSI